AAARPRTGTRRACFLDPEGNAEDPGVGRRNLGGVSSRAGLRVTGSGGARELSPHLVEGCRRVGGYSSGSGKRPAASFRTNSPMSSGTGPLTWLPPVTTVKDTSLRSNAETSALLRELSLRQTDRQNVHRRAAFPLRSGEPITESIVHCKPQEEQG